MNTANTQTDTSRGIAAAALGIAWKAAQSWLTKNNKHADPDALAACVKSWTRASIGEAIADARRAIDCGMTDAAVQTFSASMILAGIEAAKEAETPTAAWIETPTACYLVGKLEGEVQ